MIARLSRFIANAFLYDGLKEDYERGKQERRELESAWKERLRLQADSYEDEIARLREGYTNALIDQKAIYEKTISRFEQQNESLTDRLFMAFGMNPVYERQPEGKSEEIDLGPERTTMEGRIFSREAESDNFNEWFEGKLGGATQKTNGNRTAEIEESDMDS